MYKKSKISFWGCSLCVTFVAIRFMVCIERQCCMNVPVISEDRLENCTEITSLDISLINFNDERVAVDFPSNTIYISQSSEKLEHFYTLQGKLEPNVPEYSLSFLDTPAMDNVAGSVKEGIPFTLIIQSGTDYQRVNVVITTLPVLYLDFDKSGEDEQGRTLNAGTMTLWNGDNSEESYRAVTCNAEWRLRGNSTRSFSKKAWKLNLRDENSENENQDLLGLGSDDDWILNPMSMDDTFIKEKLIQNLWNQLASNTSYNYKMSKGEYVELFINGAYQGLYSLQRRIDTKYLELDKEEDILMKGVNTWEAEELADAYEIVSTPLDDEQTYDEMDKALSFKGENRINIENFMDVSLLIQFTSGYDNSGYKNMFYALEKNDNAYELRLIPWDTDLSLGVTWGYNYKGSLNAIIERQELQTIREKMAPIDREIAKRWKELRQSVFSDENIFSTYDDITEELDVSGAVKRDQEKWGLLHEGKDNRDNLKLFIQERLALLDKYYS